MICFVFIENYTKKIYKLKVPPPNFFFLCLIISWEIKKHQNHIYLTQCVIFNFFFKKIEKNQFMYLKLSFFFLFSSLLKSCVMINVIIVMKEQNFIFYKFHGKYDII